MAMKSKKSKKFKRISLDGKYIFVTVFAGLGGLMLLGSYAFSQPIATFERGDYSLSSFSTGTIGEYKLGINQKLSYCITPLVLDSLAEVILITDSGRQHITLTQTTADTACFKPIKSIGNTTALIHPAPFNTARIVAN
jgi:hypothetical protein